MFIDNCSVIFCPISQYEPYGETMLDLFGLTRQSYIGKEKEPENNLGDHGVRKYDYETGRFNSIDPLFEKYYGWSPYQYSMNNPITKYDNNGKWVKEIEKEEHRHEGTIQRNANGYLPKRINYEFYDDWKTTAPAVADFVEKNDLFVMQQSLDGNAYAQSEIGGNLSVYDLSKDKAYAKLKGNALHEIVHNMGHGEFGAWSAMLAAGYNVEDQIISNILGNSSKQGYIFDTSIDRKGKETWIKYLNGEIDVKGVIDTMKSHGSDIIKNGVKNE